MSYAIVIPTSGRESLGRLLDAIGPEGVIVVDDRRDRSRPLDVAARVVPGEGRGPAAARNAGWRAARADWVAFLDDDVLPPPGWRAALEADLRLPDDVAATQGRIVVPVPERPTDWERNVNGLERARWATADMAYRRDVLAAIGGFDERFPRAYREDADLGLRVVNAGWRIVSGARHVVHPVGPAPASISVTKQAGNADDVLMRRLHGPDWRARAGVPRGRRARHLATAAAGVGALAFRSRPLAALWAAGTAEFAWARIAPGPRTPREVATMLWTSAAIPFAATAWWLRGVVAAPRPTRAAVAGVVPRQRRAAAAAAASHPPRAAAGAAPRPPRAAAASPSSPAGRSPAAILFDRDGTLIADVPYNADPERVEPMPGAREALRRIREAGIPIGVVSNQSGIARGLVGHADVAAIHARMETLLGPLGPLEYCPHGADEGCPCRKPEPGLILRAAARLGVTPDECAMVGDIGADVGAARAAGARGVLVPTPRTLDDEVAAAPERAMNLEQAVDLLLGDVT